MIVYENTDIFLVTGASSGIGKSVAKMLNELGAKVIAVSRNQSNLNELREQAKVKDNIIVEKKDITEDIEGLSDWIRNISKKYGKLKGLILCAGASITEPLKILDYNNTKHIMDLNYFAPIMMIKGFADKRVNTGFDNTIVYVSSFAVYRGNRGQLAYTGSKGAFVSSMRTIANELIEKNIRINAVSPSHTDTPMISNTIYNNEILNDLKDKYIATAEEIANIIVFLSSKKSLWINGQDIIANRGAYFYSQEHLGK